MRIKLLDYQDPSLKQKLENSQEKAVEELGIDVNVIDS